MLRAAASRRALRATTCVALALAALGAPAAAAPAAQRSAAAGPLPPLGAHGRWLVDAAGRVVLPHGVNEVAKAAPYHPGAFGFGADDARFLAAQGFDAVRLGVELQGLMPAPGRIDGAYVDALARTVAQLARRRVFVLLDFHQDGFGPRYGGNGFPAWMSLDDGLPNPPEATFPLYYLQNPAMQRAFESFWANRPGPGGVGLQDRYVEGLSAVVRRFAREPYVIGYELLNEPWPGATWQPCLGPGGCPELEQRLLVPFLRRASAAVRRITRRQLVLAEPFVLFNYGRSPTSLPGRGSGAALAAHAYALDAGGEDAVVDNAVAAAQRDGAPALITEFGATDDAATLSRLTTGLDRGLLPWFFWAYDENIVVDRSRPASLATVRSVDALRALVRPHPVALAGTPELVSFDPAARALRLRYRPGAPGGRLRRSLPSVVALPRLTYPDGYTVSADGARVTSAPCAERLTLRTRPHAGSVTVTVTPGGRCRR